MTNTLPRLLATVDDLLHLHMCEREGLPVGQPTYEEWNTAVDELTEARQQVRLLPRWVRWRWDACQTEAAEVYTYSAEFTLEEIEPVANQCLLDIYKGKLYVCWEVENGWELSETPPSGQVNIVRKGS